MELFPFQSANVASLFSLGLLYDTEIPAGGERGIHSTFNDAIAVRVFQKTQVQGAAPFRWQFTPTPVATFVTSNFYPAWTEINAALGYVPAINAMPRIVPKVRLPALDARASASAVQAYNETVGVTILAHKMGNTFSQFSINAAHYLSPQYSLTENGNWLIAEYDFGAEMELKALVGVSIGAAVASLMVMGTQNTILQAFVNGQWTDVINTYNSLRTTSNFAPVSYILPTSVKAQKFRLINTSGTWPWSTTGHYPFSLQFYGNYTGVKPRTLGKYKHLTLLNLMVGASYSNSITWNFNVPAASTTVAGRYFGATHLSITDDIKQASTYDLLMQDAQYSYALGEVSVPTFRVKQDALVGRGV